MKWIADSKEKLETLMPRGIRGAGRKGRHPPFPDSLVCLVWLAVLCPPLGLKERRASKLTAQYPQTRVAPETAHRYQKAKGCKASKSRCPSQGVSLAT